MVSNADEIPGADSTDRPSVYDDAVPPRLTLNESVRRRRADQAFFIRLSRAIAQNRRALERLSR